MIRYVIPGNPLVLNRPRFSTRNGFPQTYDSQKREKQEVIMRLLSQRKNLPSQALISIALEFRIAPAESDKNLNLKLFNIEKNYHKDIDNLVKFYLDCGNGIIWKDDRQIFKLHAVRKFSKNPCTIITIVEIKNSLTENSMNLIKLFSPEELTKLSIEMHSIPNFDPEYYDLLNDEQKNTYLNIISKELNEFMNTWGDKLKRFKKKDIDGKQSIRF